MSWRLTLTGSLFGALLIACSSAAPEDFDEPGEGSESASGGQGTASSGGASGGGQANPGGGTSGGGGSPGSGGMTSASGGFANGGNSSGGAGGAAAGGANMAGGAQSGGAMGSTGGVAAGSGGVGSDSGGAGFGSGGASAGGTSSGGAGNGDGCEFAGHIEYSFNNFESWPADVQQRLPDVIEEAVWYYNCYADLTKQLTINFKADVPTAEGNTDGWISFGSNPGYQVVATSMHEIAHTLGVGYYPWTELTQDSRWVGSHVVEFMMNLPAEQRDMDMYSQRDYITADGQHFWPYGLNQASEHQSEWSLINNVRIVAAMHLDKQDYLSTR